MIVFKPVDLADTGQVAFVQEARNDANRINGFPSKPADKLREEIEKHQAIKPDYSAIGFVNGYPFIYLLLGESDFVANAGHIYLLAVSEDVRRQGLGREALRYAEKLFAKEGRATTTLATIAVNEVSTKFYETATGNALGQNLANQMC